jgi:hypothetical protein
MEDRPEHRASPLRRTALWAVLHVAAMALFVALASSRIAAAGIMTEADVADLAMGAFADTCTIRGMTADRAEARMRDYVAENGGDGLPFSLSFYDITLEPTDLSVTPGTDRRCEVSWRGNYAEPAARAMVQLMAKPPVFGEAIPLPITHTPIEDTFFIEGRQLNPRVAAVVHVGTRRTIAGTETFMNVERLEPGLVTN